MAFFVFLIRDPINTFAFASQVSIAEKPNMEGRMTPNPLSTRAFVLLRTIGVLVHPGPSGKMRGPCRGAE
jgi:hypothetical protein